MVEWKKLGEIAIYRRGSFPQPYGNSEWYDGEGAMPFVQVADVEDFGMKLKIKTKQHISILAMPKSVFAPEGTVVVTLQGTIGKVAITQYDSYIDRTLGIFQGFKIEINKTYFAHQLEKIFSIKKEKARGGTIKTITKEEFTNFKIPIPSLSEQNRIVGILDTFMDSIENLKQQIAQRRKQYEFYRDQLLDLEGKEGVEMKTLKELFETRNGYTPSTNNNLFWNDGIIPWFKMEDIRDNGRILSDSNLHITQTAVKGKGLFKANSIILATSATIGEHALITVEHLSNQRFTNLYPKKDYLENINMKFYYYYMFIVDGWCKNHVKQGNFASVDMNGLYNLQIPVPPLSEQNRIVSILDTFEASISNLEAQLAQRQKQYEYYRNKLLSFK